MLFQVLSDYWQNPVPRRCGMDVFVLCFSFVFFVGCQAADTLGLEGSQPLRPSSPPDVVHNMAGCFPLGQQESVSVSPTLILRLHLSDPDLKAL